jgi:hypothetical protein
VLPPVDAPASKIVLTALQTVVVALRFCGGQQTASGKPPAVAAPPVPLGVCDWMVVHTRPAAQSESPLLLSQR